MIGSGAVPDDPTSRWTQDTADSNAARLGIPYLGPDPAPSRLTSFLLMAACGVVAALHAARVVLYLKQAQLDRDLLSSGGSPASLTSVVSGAHTLTTLGRWGLLAVVATLVIEVIWRRQRRPKETTAQRGEAYVEFPIIWVTPIALRIVLAASLVAAFGLGLAAHTSATTPIADLPHLRELRAASNAVWIVAWLAFIAWVVLLNRSHQRRLAWSAPYRADPSSVPFFPPVATGGLFRGRGTPPRRGSPDTSRG